MENNKYKLNLPILNLFCFDTFVYCQSILAEEVEYYAMYDPDIINVAFYLIVFKAIEYLGKLCFNFLESSLTLEKK